MQPVILLPKEILCPCSPHRAKFANAKRCISEPSGFYRIRPFLPKRPMRESKPTKAPWRDNTIIVIASKGRRTMRDLPYNAITAAPLGDLTTP